MITHIMNQVKTMAKTRNFSPEFRLEAAQLVVDQGYTVKAACDAMGVGLPACCSTRSARLGSTFPSSGLNGAQSSSRRYSSCHNLQKAAILSLSCPASLLAICNITEC